MSWRKRKKKTRTRNEKGKAQTPALRQPLKNPKLLESPASASSSSTIGTTAASKDGGAAIFKHALCALHDTPSGWVLRPTSDTNKKLPKWSLLGLVATGTVKKKNKSDPQKVVLNYDLYSNSLVFDKTTSKVIPLDKYVEGCHPKVKAVYGCTPLAVPGAVPKGACAATAELVFEALEEQRAAQVRKLAGLKSVQAIWAMKYEADKAQVVPVGVAVITAGQLTIPGKSDFKLE